jgi:hypothetical protein
LGRQWISGNKAGHISIEKLHDGFIVENKVEDCSGQGKVQGLEPFVSVHVAAIVIGILDVVHRINDRADAGHYKHCGDKQNKFSYSSDFDAFRHFQ